MAFEDINFPVYRKYKNGKSYFKIIARNEFEEIQVIGSKKIKNLIKAIQLPEMNHVFDLVYNKDLALEITKEEYEETYNA
ncbi:MAG: hypothetical protein J0L69_09790 [Bacteroidetes bacterium]|nr:hypothetical protein [Bacteroidota bacterium]